MRRPLTRASVAAICVCLLSSPAAADDTKLTYAELSASAGYSSMPSFGLNDAGGVGRGRGSAFLRLTARGVHSWSTERTSTQVIGYWEGSDYLNRHGLRNLVSFRGQTSHSLSERVSVNGSAGFSADFGGQLSNRFVYPVTDPTQLDEGVLPAEAFYSGRQYRADGSIGIRASLSPRDQISGTAGVSRISYPGSLLRDHTAETLSGSYQRTLSERSTAGVRLTANRTTFDHSADVSLVVNPAATFTTQIAEGWSLGGAAGVTFASLRRAGADYHTTSPSFSAHICHETTKVQLCAMSSHTVQSSGFAELVTVTTGNLEWVDHLDQKQNLQLSAGYSHYGHGVAEVNTLTRRDDLHVAARYSRNLSNRASVGVDTSVRRFIGFTTGRDLDLSGSAFVRIRLGDLG